MVRTNVPFSTIPALFFFPFLSFPGLFVGQSEVCVTAFLSCLVLYHGDITRGKAGLFYLIPPSVFTSPALSSSPWRGLRNVSLSG